MIHSTNRVVAAALIAGALLSGSVVMTTAVAEAKPAVAPKPAPKKPSVPNPLAAGINIVFGGSWGNKYGPAGSDEGTYWAQGSKAVANLFNGHH